MNTNTGEIKYFSSDDVIPDEFIKITEDQITDKQQETLQVSKHDNKSYLGHLFTEHRNEIGDMKRRSAKDIAKTKAKRKVVKNSRKTNRK